jgi:hypothetical protein
MLGVLLLAAVPIPQPAQFVQPGAVAFVIAGQSNAAGASPRLPEDELEIPGIYAVRKDGRFWPAVEPLDTKPNSGSGFGRAFAVRFLERHPEVPQVFLVHCGFVRTAIRQWQRNEQPFDHCVALINDARNAGLPIGGVLWHQGEQDAAVAATTQAAYALKLRDFITALRVETGPVPFLAGELGRFLPPGSYPARAVVVRATAIVVGATPASAFVSSLGLKDKGDRAHFDRDSQIELGRRFADALEPLLTH